MKIVIRTKNAPEAIGPYSQAVSVGDLVFVSGQIPINPASGQIEAEDIRAQTRQVLENLKAILTSAGLGLRHVAKTTVYLASLDDFKAMNEVYGEYFAEEPPARATVEVSKLPLGSRVEIDAIAKR